MSDHTFLYPLPPSPHPYPSSCVRHKSLKVKVLVSDGFNPHHMQIRAPSLLKTAGASRSGVLISHLALPKDPCGRKLLAHPICHTLALYPYPLPFPINSLITNPTYHYTPFPTHLAHPRSSLILAPISPSHRYLP